MGEGIARWVGNRVTGMWVRRGEAWRTEQSVIFGEDDEGDRAIESSNSWASTVVLLNRDEAMKVGNSEERGAEEVGCRDAVAVDTPV